MGCVTVNKLAGHTVHLSMGKGASCEQMGKDEIFDRSITSLKEASIQGFKPLFNELDLVAYVLDVGLSKTGNFQAVTLADESLSCCRLLVWGGLEAAGVNEILQIHRVIYFRNIEWRTNSGSGCIPNLYLSEHTVMSLNPREKVQMAAVQRLQEQVKSPHWISLAKEQLSKQLNKVFDRKSTTSPSLCHTPGVRAPKNTSCSSLPPRTSAWGRAALSEETASRVAQLDAYTNNLAKQGCNQISMPMRELPPLSDKVLAPFRPPSSTQEMEDYANEVMDQLDM